MAASEWDGTAWAGDAPTFQTRAIDSFTAYPGLEDQLLALQGAGRKTAWKALSIRQALAVPAVFRAATLIANVVGSLVMEAFREGERMTLPPRIVQRPDPFRTARDFYRDTAWSLVTRGEFLWYVGARDPLDRTALSLLLVNPAEIRVEWDDDRIHLARYFWRDIEVPREAIVHGTFTRELGSPRGLGPLQICGAALSVAAEADEWAASFFGGAGIPSVVLRPKYDVTDAEAEALKTKWTSTPSNTPRVAGNVDVDVVQVNPEQAQLVQARLSSVGEVARMFGIPGKLLEYSVQGSSLTYQNLAEVGQDLIRFSLAPNYLEPIEQAMSDLLPRTTVSRFNVEGLMRADVETRYRIAGQGLTDGIHTREEAREIVGLASNIEVMPVPSNPARPTVPADIARRG